NGGIRVISPIDDTPAQAAGILPNDLIVRLDDRPVNRMSLADAVGIMRGEPGTKIKLTIVRQGSDVPLVFTLTRAVIRIRSVRSYFLDDNFGYLRVTQFQTPTPELAREQIHELFKESNAMEGLVLDLRNNPGGELQSAVGVSDLFIDQGVIVKTRARNNTNEQVFNATPGDLAKGIPIVVLVNEGSASASEIVAGALQDHNRAIIMGTQTFGKGSVQTIWSLDKETTLKLTTHLYYTPSDRSIQALGIVPDITIESRDLPALEQEEVGRLREADLEGSLDGEDLDDGLEEENGSSLNPAVKEDYQLQEALNLLKGLSIARRQIG
ncbi:MAG: S41 family peptidase, partial [Gammaproteobacteria bacterium]|nr:S41 family peptidase [Gammaproteobacteria bacterium]